jgi:pyrroline-5-carboxylate reductase
MVDVRVIGCGHLGSAVIRGLARAGGHTITACDVSEAALADIEDAADRTTTDLEGTEAADLVILAVKPDVVDAVLQDLALDPEQTLLSFAAGVSIEFLESRTDATVVRGMPNLAAEVNEMACAVAGEPDEKVEAVLSSLGRYVEIDEAQMDVATALNGSGPAFVFYLIGALADAGVRSGLDPEAARVLAAQTAKGAAETVLQADREIDALIDAVCSEGGTTIEGMEVLWDSTVVEDLGAAVAAAERRSEEITEEHA